MGNDSFRFQYDPTTALRNCPKLLGMELTQRGRQLEGPYYINGERHPYRRDKLKCFIWKGRVFVQEEGGQMLSLENWLQQYGGAADYKEALRIINGERQAIDNKHDTFRFKKEEVKYVSPDVLQGAKAYDLRLSPLFRWMCGLFPEDRVREVWGRYNVTANGKGGTVFWYLNPSGRICHDKVCWYGEDGHRIRTLPMGRKFKIGDGYSEKPMFGAHLGGEIKGILESEKSCLLAACYYGGSWMATGGKNALRDPGRIPLYPDIDAFGDWQRLGNCVEWYSDWPECGDHSDLGDYIEWKILNNRKI